MSNQEPHYRAPGWFTRNIANRLVGRTHPDGHQRLGQPGAGGPGRTSGEPRQVPVNLLAFEGEQYLVSARGEGQWVRNVRAAGGELTCWSAGAARRCAPSS